VVPVVYQKKIIDAYAGPSRILNLKKARHSSSLNLREQREYRILLEWLRNEVIPVPEPELVGSV
jgi:hypothetical protein